MDSMTRKTNGNGYPEGLRACARRFVAAQRTEAATGGLLNSAPDNSDRFEKAYSKALDILTATRETMLDQMRRAGLRAVVLDDVILVDASGDLDTDNPYRDEPRLDIVPLAAVAGLAGA